MHMIIYTLQATTCKCSYCCCRYTLCSPQYRLQAQVDTFVSATFHRFAYALYIPMSKTHLSRCLLFSHFLKLLNLLFLVKTFGNSLSNYETVPSCHIGYSLSTTA